MSNKEKRWPGEPEGLWDAPRSTPPRREVRSAAERLSTLDEALVLPYPRAERVRGEILRLMEKGRRPPYVGAMIAGPRSNGRSTVTRDVVDRDRKEEAWYMTMPVRASYDDFWLAVIDRSRGYGSGHYRNGYELPRVARQLEAQTVLRGAVGAGLRLIVVDGCESLLEASASHRRLMLHCVQRAWDVGDVPVVLVGTPPLASKILSDRDRVGAYEILMLPQWRLDADFLDLLHAWDEALPLQQWSGLADRDLAMHCFALSDGILGALAGVLTTAAAAAILTGREKITIELLDELGFEVPPSFSGFMF